MMQADKLALSVLAGRGKAKLVEEVDALIQQAGRDLGETAEEAALVSGGAPVDALVRLRLLPPRGGSEDVAPRFRLLWVNAAECWAAALGDLATRAGALMPTHPVFHGSPDIIHYR